jgi:hypothetical protein
VISSGVSDWGLGHFDGRGWRGFHHHTRAARESRTIGRAKSIAGWRLPLKAAKKLKNAGEIDHAVVRNGHRTVQARRVAEIFRRHAGPDHCVSLRPATRQERPSLSSLHIVQNQTILPACWFPI